MISDVEWQSADAVARSVAILMADSKRQGQLIYSVGGRFSDIEESVLLPPATKIVGEGGDDQVIARLHKIVEGQKIGYS